MVVAKTPGVMSPCSRRQKTSQPSDVELAAAQVGDARLIGAEPGRDLVGVPPSEPSRDFGAGLALELFDIVLRGLGHQFL